MPNQGFFIAFEGGEGGGKTTQMRLLAARLRRDGHRVILTREPGGTSLGRRLRRLLLNGGGVAERAELFLYEADRAQHVAERVRPALGEGTVVLTDRHADSSTVYQGMCRGLGTAVVLRLNHFATGGLRPDLVIVLDVPPDVGLGRVRSRGRGPDRMEREKREFHSKVRRGFLALARKRPGSTAVLDGRRPKGELADEISALVLRRLRRRLG